MPKTGLERRWGGGCEDPCENDMRAALAELDTPDDEHPSCWLTDENGWALSAYQSGLVIFESLAKGEGPWHLKNQTYDQVIELWRLLQLGEIEKIRNRPWQNGYGCNA